MVEIKESSFRIKMSILVYKNYSAGFDGFSRHPTR